MTLEETLGFVGITLESYTALRRHESVTFLPRRKKRQSSFTHAEFIAIKMFHTLRSLGMTIKVAAEAVENAFPRILAFTKEGVLGSEDQYLVSLRILAVRGRKCIVQDWEAVPQDARRVGEVTVDIRGVAALLTLADFSGN